MDFFKSEKGEFTVEATIVFTLSFMVIIIMLYIGIVMYQHVHLQSITDRVASRGAMMYATRTTNFETGAKSVNDFWNSDPYRYVYDGSYKKDAEGVIKSKIKKEVGIGNVVKANKNDTADAKVELGLFSRKVVTTGSRKFNVPFVSIFSLDNSLFDLNVKSTAYIMDMPETIKNVDYICDLINRTSASQAIEKVGKLKSQLISFIDKIKVK